jgi:DNA-binding IclR family transcriptional regulator
VAEAQLSAAQIVKRSGMAPERVRKNLAQLTEEGFIKKKGRTYFI